MPFFIRYDTEASPLLVIVLPSSANEHNILNVESFCCSAIMSLGLMSSIASGTFNEE